MRLDWVSVLLFLLLGSCSVAIIGSAGYCIAAHRPDMCPHLEINR
jgi:hypothetical protein